MAWQQTPHHVVIFLATLISAGLAAYGIRHLRHTRQRTHVVAFVVLQLAIMEWTLLYGIQVGSTTIEAKLLAYKLLHVGGAVVPPAWLVFSLGYADYDAWISRGFVGVLAVVPVALALTLPTNPGSVVLTDVSVVRTGSLLTLQTGDGPMYSVFLTYSYVLLLAGSVLLARVAVRRENTFRGTSALLLAGVSVPFLFNLLNIFELFPPGGAGLNYTPVSLAVSGVFFGIAIFRRELFDLKPIARKTIFENMGEGVVVVNERGRLVDVNPRAQEILGVDADVVGARATDVIPRYDEFARLDTESIVVEFENGADDQFVVMSRSPLDQRTKRIGWVVLLHDITERKAYEHQLEKQRDDLEVLNQVLRHDIRNDLQIVTGHADVLAERVEDENQEYVQSIRDNANHAVELTTAARDMATVMLSTRDTDDQRVGLRDVLESELEQVRSAYPNAEVSMADSVPAAAVRADDMLDSVFRNLLRNAIQHNDAEVPTITVSALVEEDTVQVQVADNGPGVPDSLKDAIFGSGETGLESRGSGIGLYLVETLVSDYDGKVWVEDNYPDGSVFVVELNRAAESATT